MLTLTVKELRESLNSFANLAGQRISNVRLAYNLGKTLKSLQEEAKYIGEQEKEIFTRYGATEQKQMSGDVALSLDQDALTAEQRKEFADQIAVLQSLQIEVWGSKVSLADLEISAVIISAHDFSVLNWLIADEEVVAIAKAETAGR